LSLARLAHAINAARQLAQAERGRGLDAGRADRIAAHLRAAQNLVRGRADVRIKPEPPRILQTGTRRFRLWRRSPLCLWCGRETRIEGVHEADAATLDHLRRKGERAGPSSLPDTVLACRECNHTRGQPKARTSGACPVDPGGREGADGLKFGRRHRGAGYSKEARPSLFRRPHFFVAARARAGARYRRAWEWEWLLSPLTWIRPTKAVIYPIPPRITATFGLLCVRRLS
jgi:hypothetical protein